MTGLSWLDGLPALPPVRGLGAAFLLFLATLVLLNLGGLVRAARRPLAPTGLLPVVLDGTELALRALALLLGLGALAALLPAPLAATFGWVVLAGALAVGWSAQAPLADWVGWLVLLAEGRLIPGRWVELDGESGQIVALTARAVWLRRPDGAEVAWPHRRLLAARLRLRVSPWAEVEVDLGAADATGAEVQQALNQALLASPGVIAVVGSPARGQAADRSWRAALNVVPGQEAQAQTHLPDRFQHALRALRAQATAQRGSLAPDPA